MTRYGMLGSWESASNATNSVTVWPNQYDSSTYRWYPLQPCACHTKVVAEKVSLTLDEIDQLRAAAKADPNLRAALNKLARLIDIEVSF